MVIQEDGRDIRVMLQNPQEFRPAITAVTDNANVAGQWLNILSDE